MNDSLYSNNQYDDDFLLHRNLDVKLDYYCNEQQKDIKRLPTNIRTIKELIYDYLLPKIETRINDLEEIKKTSNYDEDCLFLPFNSIIDSQIGITALDCFNNHNIKGKSDNKIIYGTATGELIISDIESGRIIVSEKNAYDSRIEIIQTSTIKFFDTFISRIIVAARGNPKINIYSYNHSYSSIFLDESINLATYASSNQQDVGKNVNKDKNKKDNIEENVSLSILPIKIKISKDSFFAVFSTYDSKNFIFKFGEIPLAGSDKAHVMLKDDVNKMNSSTNNFNSNNNQNKRLSSININSIEPFIKLIDIIELLNTKNFELVSVPKLSYSETGLNFNKKNYVTAPKDDKKNKDIKKAKKDKDNKEDEFQEYIEEPINHDSTKYNITENRDNFNNDCSSLQLLPANIPYLEFIQKKIISEDIENDGFSSVLITSGLYFSFHNTSEVVFYSLMEHFNKQMTNIFKISKVRGQAQMNEEELFTMKTKIGKAEKELYSFFKKKLESTGNNNNQIANNSSMNVNNSKINNNANKDTKDKNAKPEEIENKSLFRFTIISRISAMNYAVKFNNKFNFLALGLKNGRILIWDCELHSDKFYLDTECSNEITHVNINDAYCFSCSLNGKVFIHSLITSELIYECLNNPYCNFPINTALPVFPYVSFSIDESNRGCLYYLKDQHKIAKFNMEYNGKHYNIQKLNYPLISYSKDYIAVVLQEEKEYKKTNLIDMLDFVKNGDKKVLKEYSNIEYAYRQVEFNSKAYYEMKINEIEDYNKSLTEYLNKYPDKEIKHREFTKQPYDFAFFNHKIGNEQGKNIIGLIKIKDVFLKCYPELRISIKNNSSIKKIMENNTLKSLTLHEINNDYYYKSMKDANNINTTTSKKINSTFGQQLSANNKLLKNLSSNSKAKFETNLKANYINHLGTIESAQNVALNYLNSKESFSNQALFSPNNEFKAPKKNYKEEKELKNKIDTLRHDLKAKKNDINTKIIYPGNSKSKKDLFNVLKGKASNNLLEKHVNKLKIPDSMIDKISMVNTNSIKDENSEIIIKENELEKDSEKKNIFYNSFKNIRDRYSYREQRINKIQMRNERIEKQLKLPVIYNYINVNK